MEIRARGVGVPGLDEARGEDLLLIVSGSGLVFPSSLLHPHAPMDVDDHPNLTHRVAYPHLNDVSQSCYYYHRANLPSPTM
jgi:hypothetical protein